jgi:hypothetical protein
MDNNGHCIIQRKSSLSIGKGRWVNGYRPSAFATESINVSFISRREDESENHRIRNGFDSGVYNDVGDVAEGNIPFVEAPGDAKLPIV